MEPSEKAKKLVQDFDDAALDEYGEYCGEASESTLPLESVKTALLRYLAELEELRDEVVEFISGRNDLEEAVECLKRMGIDPYAPEATQAPR